MSALRISNQGTSTTPVNRQHRLRFVLVAVLVLNVMVALAKIAIGVMIGSLAMSADGLHSLLDGAANVVALVGLAIASRPPDRDHPYGHQRFETLTSLAIAGFMLLAIFGILQSAWDRFQSGGTPEFAAVGLVVMVATLAVNIGVTLWERREARNLDSTILAADARHTMSDVFVSLSVIVSLVLVWAGFGGADLLVSLVIAGLIGRGAWHIVRDASLLLSDQAVEDPQEIQKIVLAVPGVEGAHAIRSRGGDGRIWVDLHIQVDPELSVEEAHDISSDVSRQVADEIGQSADVTVHVEPATGHHLRDTRGHRFPADDA